MKFPKRWRGEKLNRKWVAWPKVSKKLKAKCRTCKRPIRRSWRTGILHVDCFACRYLKMIYGPSIEVKWIEE